MKLSIIAAIAANGVIGRGDDLPWQLSADLKRFKALTMGHHLILGRKTFDSIGRSLPGRTMVVISRSRPRLPSDVLLADSLGAAIEIAISTGDGEAFVAGGAQIYTLALPLADRLYLTRIEASFEGDTLFPKFDQSDWILSDEEIHPATESTPWQFRFQVWDRSA